MGGVAWRALKRPDDHSFNACIINAAGRSGARLVIKAFQTVLGEAPAPFADRRLVQPKPGRNLLALLTFRAGQHNARAHRHRLSGLAPPGQRHQLGPFNLAQRHHRRRSPSCHRRAPMLIRTRIWHDKQKL